MRTNRRGQTQRVITDLGAVQYRYELSINEVFANATGIAYETYRAGAYLPRARRGRRGSDVGAYVPATAGPVRSPGHATTHVSPAGITPAGARAAPRDAGAPDRAPTAYT